MRFSESVRPTRRSSGPPGSNEPQVPLKSPFWGHVLPFLLGVGLGRLFSKSPLPWCKTRVWRLKFHMVVFQSLYLFIFKIYSYFWLRWVFVALRGLSLVVASGGYSLVVNHGLLIAVASPVAEHGL